jgi:hypothetical protein
MKKRNSILLFKKIHSFIVEFDPQATMLKNLHAMLHMSKVYFIIDQHTLWNHWNVHYHKVQYPKNIPQKLVGLSLIKVGKLV